MKTNPLFALAIALVLFVMAYSLQTRNAVAQAPAVVAEQYQIITVPPGQSDAQVVARLNAAAADGWRVRCSATNGIILAR
jgi:hypothetical protein